MPPDDHLDGRDVDAEFAAIIAGWDSVPDLPPSLSDDDAWAPPASDAASAPSGASSGEPGPVEASGSSDNEAQLPDAPPAASGHARPDERDQDPAPGGHGSDPSPPAREAPPPGIVESSLEEGHFEPRPVQLPPHEDLHFWGIVIGLTVGPLLLLFMALFGQGHSRWWTYAAFALVIGGFALLVLRQPRSRDDDDHDDGARV